jgi:hypothetical protein
VILVYGGVSDLGDAHMILAASVLVLRRTPKSPGEAGSRAADDSGMLEHFRESDNPASSRRPSKETGRVSNRPGDGGGRLAVRTRFNVNDRTIPMSANDMKKVTWPCGNL